LILLLRLFAMFILASPLLLAFPGQAESATTTKQIPPNPNIKIAYQLPANLELIPLYERLRARQVLESMQRFLSPLVLTREIEVQFEQCDAPELRYKPGGPATICYEYVAQIERMAPSAQKVELSQGTVTREETIVGPTVQAVLHQAALAIFDALDVPVWGRREDAADRVAAFVMLQFGGDTAWSTIVGSAWFLAGSAGAPSDFGDVRGTVAQRYYTMLCIAMGSPLMVYDQQLFATFASTEAAGSLPSERVANCRNEYAMQALAFEKTLAPYVDPAKLELVRSKPMNWIVYRQ
jgi:hypothetical protein